MSLQPVSQTRAILGEGPVWHHHELLWIDIEGRKVIRFDPDSGNERIIELPERIGCVWPCSGDSRLVCGLQSGFAFIDPDSGAISPISNPEEQLARTRFNDGKCDPLGRFWAGTMDMEENEALGSLYMLDSRRQVTQQWQGVTVSNGLAWDPDGITMYYIDSPTRKVAAFDYEAATGKLSNHRTAIEIPEGEGFPDGMTIDTDGNLWIALWQGWGIVRYNPKSGERLEKIDVPVERVTSCIFGGADHDELFITTASIGVDATSRPQLDAGALFHLKTKYQGLPAVPFECSGS